MRDRQRSFWATGESGCLGGMVGEPAPQTVLERVNLACAKEQVITGLTVQAAVAGVPVRARAGEVGCADQRVLASAPSRTGPCWAASHRATVTAWRGLTIPQLTRGGAWLGHRGQAEPFHGGPGQQDPLGQWHVRRDPGTLRGRAVASDSNAAGPGRAFISGPLPQVSRTHKPVSLGGMPESPGRAEIDFL